MKKLSFLCGMLLLSALSFTACSDDDMDNGGGKPSGGDGAGEVSGVMNDLFITGHVRDTDGNPLSGVKVSSGTSVMITNASGMFSFSKIDVVNNRSVIRFVKDGYFDIVRSLEAADGDWEVVMCVKGNGDISSTNTYFSDQAQTITAGGMKIDMPENGYMVDETGRSYNGTVNTEMVYLDPNNDNFAEMMPGGDLAATRTDGSETMLVSYGMTAVNMTDAEGNKLQLKEGSKATLTFPIPDGMTDNLPETIPLWSFNEKNGLWEEEGVAHLQGNVYVGEVTHFSWVNLDEPEDDATVKGYVRDNNGRALPNVRVNVGQISVTTDASGYYEADVPANNAFELTVKPSAYGNYRNIFARPVSALKPKEERTVNIVLPTLNRVFGRIVNKGGGSNSASICIEYGNNKNVTKSVVSDPQNGEFTTYAPDGYTGDAIVKVLCSDGTIKNIPVRLGNVDIDLKDIVISSEIGNGGIIVVELSNGQTVSFDVPNGGGTGMSGIVVIDDKLNYIDDETNEDTRFSIMLDGYDEGKTNYENASLLIEKPSDSEGFYADGNAKVSLTEKNDKFIFNISGTGAYFNQNSQLFDQNASFITNDLTLDLFMKGSTSHNVDPLQIGLPSFTPTLSQKAPVVLKISNSKICSSGGVIYYNGTKNDYDALLAKAANSGVKLIGEESDDEYGNAIYFSNNKYIVITFNANANPISSSDSFMDIDDAQISVTALEDVDSDMLGGFMSAGSTSFASNFKQMIKKRR